MRNLFDQYDEPENRLSHALGCSLDHDQWLLRSFVRWVTRRQPPKGRVVVEEQHVPGTPLTDADDTEEIGLPDLWVHDNEQWSLIIENKVGARVSMRQLMRHRATAERNGFTDVTLIVLTPEVPRRRMPGVLCRTWPQVYAWMRRQARRSEWAGHMADYIEIAEVHMTADGYLGEKPLTRFDGIPFGPDHPYSYREAKRAMKLALAELRKRPELCRLGMDQRGPGRPAITGRDGTTIWDFLPLRAARGKAAFTACPHLDLSIQTQRTLVIVSLPHAVSARMRHNVTDLGAEGFQQLLADVERDVSKAIRVIEGAYPFMETLQRHYTSQRAAPVVDASLEYDLRTTASSRKSKVKTQPEWAKATFLALSAKRSNLHVGIGAALPYGDPRIRSRDVLDIIAGIWVGCRPWIRTILGKT